MSAETNSKSLVLYVDDDSDDLLLVREAFERHSDIELVTFSDSYAFLKYIIKNKPFRRLPILILIDINMPLLNGRELLVLLRSYEGLKEVPMILYSTSNLESDNQIARSLNAGFITKPASMQKLNASIDDLLMKCRATT